jgi:DNA replication protein DnaC
MIQAIGEVIPEFMLKHIKEVGIEKCNDCGKEFKILEHYDPEGNLKFKSNNCPYCMIRKEDERIAREAIEERTRLKLDRFKRYSEIPFELEAVTFDEYDPQNQTQINAKAISLSFAKEEYEKTTLFFQGDTGLGKTHLSYCVYKSFVDNKKGAIFIDLPSLLADIRNTFSNGNDHRATTQEAIMKAINDCELLVLDDIGAEYVKPDANGFESWAADIIFQIANSRQGKKNIYTTNFTSKHLTQKYGMMSKRIISRLMSNAKVIKVEGDDHRLKGLE